MFTHRRVTPVEADGGEVEDGGGAEADVKADEEVAHGVAEVPAAAEHLHARRKRSGREDRCSCVRWPLTRRARSGRSHAPAPPDALPASRLLVPGRGVAGRRGGESRSASRAAWRTRPISALRIRYCCS